MRLAVLLFALSYVMPSYSVLKRLANGRDDLELSSLRVDGTAVVPAALAGDIAQALGITAGPGELTLGMVVSMRLPGRCRVELTSLDSTKTVAAVTNNGKKRADGPEVPALAVVADQVCGLLALHGAGDGDSRAAIEKHLQAFKIDPRGSALARFHGKLAYIIGDAKNANAQLWVYKSEKFPPARVRFLDAGGASWDVQFIDYTSQSTGDWFPRQVEVYKADVLQLRLTTLNADNKAKLDDKLF